ncbi:NAD-dependent epimerase/dehydratase family protein [Microbacterium sp. RD1]|uniref:NAD-dependent epimerase/dehydratase family protein n=1 Tax=Microbacterium sp. RD1 TaxID=3457313 RepID=UPI003FA555E7
MKIVVTGGAGFIGSNFARYALSVDPENEIVVLDDLSTGKPENLAGIPIRFVDGSVADRTTVRAVVHGADAIVHLGALGSVPRSIKDPVASHHANLTGTLEVLEAARAEGAYVVFASSSSVYGANPQLPKSEDAWTRPMSPYAVTKLGAEGYVIAYQFAYGLSSLAFRFFNVYGPYQAADHAYAAVIPRFIDAALAGRPLTIYGDGHQSRDFTHVKTVCSALYSAVSRRLVSESPVNLAFGTNTTLVELVEIIGERLGITPRVEHAEPRKGDVRASQADSSLLRGLLPEVQPVPLREGIESTVAWFKGEDAWQ